MLVGSDSFLTVGAPFAQGRSLTTVGSLFSNVSHFGQWSVGFVEMSKYIIYITVTSGTNDQNVENYIVGSVIEAHQA